MISNACRNKQFRRLFRLPMAPTEAEDITIAKEELNRVFDTYGRSDAHLDATVSRVCDTAQYFPPPAAIVEAAKETPDPEVAEGPEGCAECGGTGWLSSGVIVHGVEIDVSDFCPCPLGIWKRAAALAYQIGRLAAQKA